MALAVFAVNWRGLPTCGRADGVADIAHSCLGAPDTRSDLTLTFLLCCKGADHGLSSLDKERPRPMTADDGGYTLPYTLEDSLL